jgi:predicted CoA-binding protein
VIIVIPPEQVIPIIDEAAKLGIHLLWIQQGANSVEAEKRCQELGLEYVSGECIFMFLEPVESIHKFHRFFKRLFGRMPA